MSSPKIQLIDVNDKPSGESDVYSVHQHPAKLHRAISVWLFNDSGGVLLQQRSAKKITKALEWGNAVCGNVRSNESYYQCAMRRLREEIGVESIQVRPIYKFLYKAWCNDKYGENELDQVFIGQYSGRVKLNKDEADDYVWIDWNKFKKAIKEKVSGLDESIKKAFLNPSLTTSMDLDELKKNTKSLKITVDGRELLMVPWTIMMALDKRLVNKN